ncbi:MAG: DUF3136 domain-containing protein [Cyanobacteriota bacterium]|jgi:hypothetical protein
MGHPTFTTTLTIHELEDSYSLYCNALRILIREGKSMQSIKRSVCWCRLSELHALLPRQYRDPDHLYLLIKREIGA